MVPYQSAKFQIFIPNIKKVMILYHGDWEFLFGNLGHFPLEFFCQIWTQDTLWHLLGPFLVNFDICQFLATPGPFK